MRIGSASACARQRFMSTAPDAQIAGEVDRAFALGKIDKTRHPLRRILVGRLEFTRLNFEPSQHSVGVAQHVLVLLWRHHIAGRACNRHAGLANLSSSTTAPRRGVVEGVNAPVRHARLGQAGRRIRINQLDDENARCKVSGASDQRENCSPFTPPLLSKKPPSISNPGLDTWRSVTAAA